MKNKCWLVELIIHIRVSETTRLCPYVYYCYVIPVFFVCPSRSSLSCLPLLYLQYRRPPLLPRDAYPPAPTNMFSPVNPVIYPSTGRGLYWAKTKYTGTPYYESCLCRSKDPLDTPFSWHPTVEVSANFRRIFSGVVVP